MSELEKYQPPRPSVGDAAHAVVKAGLSSIPIVGGAATELFNAFITPPIERRRRAWMEEVGNALQKLETERGVQLEALQANETFIDTVMQASQVAIRNTQEEKRRALRNAVMNAALPNPPEESLQESFVAFLDLFTVWHLRVLKLFQDPQGWAQHNRHQFPSFYMGGLSSVLESAYPELGSRRELYDQLWQDLYQRGLVNTDSMHTTMTATGMMAKRTTVLGDQFLRFIEEPA
jgi:hypothetical protein